MTGFFDFLRTCVDPALGVLGAIGSIASVIALFTATRVVNKLREQQRIYTRQIVLPQYSEHLDGFIQNVEKARSHKSTRNIRKGLVQCRATLESVKNYVESPLTERIANVICALDTFLDCQLDRSPPDGVDEVVIQLHGVLRSVQNLEIELHWRKTNA
jgi:hypothetical protein